MDPLSPPQSHLLRILGALVIYNIYIYYIYPPWFWLLQPGVRGHPGPFRISISHPEVPTESRGGSSAQVIGSSLACSLMRLALESERCTPFEQAWWVANPLSRTMLNVVCRTLCVLFFCFKVTFHSGCAAWLEKEGILHASCKAVACYIYSLI